MIHERRENRSLRDRTHEAFGQDFDRFERLIRTVSIEQSRDQKESIRVDRDQVLVMEIVTWRHLIKTQAPQLVLQLF